VSSLYCDLFFILVLHCLVVCSLVSGISACTWHHA
jgi:hypothetical protein